MLDWAHVRIFSPWRYNVDQAAQRLLERHGWRLPRPDYLPTGGEIFRDYLEPLARTPEMAALIETGARVTAVTRLGMDKVTSSGREDRPFVLSVVGKDGKTRRELARAVIDASGTWTQQNPLGGSGVPADGEKEHADRLDYRMPDVLGRDRALYAGRRTAVVGAGYSAANVLIDLAKLARDEPKTSIVWIVRGTNLIRVYGGGLADGLPARGELGADVKALVDSGQVTLVTGFSTAAVRSVGEGIVLDGETAEGLRRSRPIRPRGGHDRAAAGSRSHARASARSRSVAGKREGARSADRSERAFLRLRAAARAPRAFASRGRLLYRRREELRTRADLSAPDRLRAGPLGRRGNCRRPRRS